MIAYAYYGAWQSKLTENICKILKNKANILTISVDV